MTLRARSFADFAPPALAPYLQNVWLGAPDESIGDDAARIPLTSLADHRAALLAAMHALYGGDAELHARALLSQWSKYYFGLAAPAGVAAARLLGRPLDMSPERTHLVLKEGVPVALHFDADALHAPDADPARRYDGLVAHLDSVIGMIAGMTKIAPRVLWSNAGNLLDYLLGNCPSILSDDGSDAEWLFRPADDNPLRTPIRDATPRSPLLPNPFRARRVCCVRYEIPGETQLCASCPLLLTMRDDELALQDAIR
ncbi:ferric iron reductase (plasmid) [Burkholderia sp. THE68]|jgi:ferric iron reductase protein FhuF|uniref:siderophore-iron reductase FhuF n=1 Tax=Burkholderia sp. THE68 TaxID=758782 RepID=UPI001319A13C|nr:siderophore-iron reductase FhuF [Burkholderia sp. THE68]BBU32958.1 ferric iron reductase [Burkholderia sp. THE68]